MNCSEVMREMLDAPQLRNPFHAVTRGKRIGGRGKIARGRVDRRRRASAWL
jgi:hypothetical protein